MKFNMFSLSLTGHSDFLILFISTQYKLYTNGFSKIWMIRFIALHVVNYMVKVGNTQTARQTKTITVYSCSFIKGGMK